MIQHTAVFMKAFFNLPPAHIHAPAVSFFRIGFLFYLRSATAAIAVVVIVCDWHDAAIVVGPEAITETGVIAIVEASRIATAEAAVWPSAAASPAVIPVISTSTGRIPVITASTVTPTSTIPSITSITTHMI